MPWSENLDRACGRPGWGKWAIRDPPVAAGRLCKPGMIHKVKIQVTDGGKERKRVMEWSRERERE